MSNPKRSSKHRLGENHLGISSRGFSGNKGKQMNSKARGHAQVMQTKGE
ncbi:small acid-soluble spore protein N [Bacillus fonticola]|nr:small acid-soluble spore protein N [Bacillus fonticola]